MEKKLMSVVESQQFSKEWLEIEFFPTVRSMETVLLNERSGCKDLKGKGMVSFFYEPSTRTRASFEIAMKKMGGDVIFSTENASEFSSVVKGETLEDTIRVLNRYYPDIIVSRFANEGDAKRAAWVSAVPIINAGDGAGQHPTQALLDVCTIQKVFSQVNNITITMIGDLAKGRTVRSLCYLLGKFKNISINFVSPAVAKMRDDIKDYLEKHGVKYQEYKSIKESIKKSPADVYYQTRPQRERGTAFDLSEDKGAFVLCEETADSMPDHSIIMHPLPRTEEITLEVDLNPRSVYLTKQVECGLFSRMALLKMILS